MKILYASNYIRQFTGYGTITRNLLPKIQERSDHEFVHFAVSGLTNVPAHEVEGIKCYGNTSSGGNLGMYDLPVVRKQEDVDWVHMNFDVWAMGEVIQQYDFNFSVYPPVDHDPLPLGWGQVFNKATKIVPYCKFGERVMKNEIGEGGFGLKGKQFYEPIYHGVDTDTFRPEMVSKNETLGTDEEDFVVMINKNNQGTRAALERQMRAFRIFLNDPEVDEDEAKLFVNSNIQGSNAFDLGYVIQRLGLEDNVMMVNQDKRRYGIPTEQLVKFYNASDVLLNCTRGEGFGLPIIEAFACGKPVIGTAYSSMPEILSGEEGEIRKADDVGELVKAERGLLCPTHDVHMTLGKHSWRREIHAQTIASALKYAYQNREEMEEKGNNAHDWVQQYDWDNIADKWVEFFDQMEEETFSTDDDGIQWEKIQKEKGGVGAFNR